MKRSFKLYPHVTASVPNRVKLAVTRLLGAMLVAGLGCTGVIHGDSGPTGSGNQGGPSGTGAGSGSGGTGTGSGSGGTGTGSGSGGTGTAGQGGDPYAIPTSPPASVLVPTSASGAAQPPAVVERGARPPEADGHLGHRQQRIGRCADRLRRRGGRSVRDGAAALAAVRCVGAAGGPGDRRRDGAGAPRPRQRADGHGRSRQGLRHRVRAARVPASADERRGDHPRRAVQSGADALSRGRRLQGGRQPGDPGDAAIAVLPVPDRARHGRAPAPARWRSTTGRWAPSWRSRSPTPSPTTRCWRRPRPGSCTTRPPWSTQAKRLLDGTTGTAGVSNFNLQVYRLGTYDGIIRDPTVFPDFTPNTPAAMKQEVLQFLSWIFAQNRGIKDFYTTPSVSWTRCWRRSTA